MLEDLPRALVLSLALVMAGCGTNPEKAGGSVRSVAGAGGQAGEPVDGGAAGKGSGRGGEPEAGAPGIGGDGESGSDSGHAGTPDSGGTGSGRGGRGGTSGVAGVSGAGVAGESGGGAGAGGQDSGGDGGDGGSLCPVCRFGACYAVGTEPYFCHCWAGYSGERCDVREPCAPNPCNGGTCVPSSDRMTPICTCPPGFTGTYCESDVDECATDNGGCDPLTQCTNSTGSHSCGPCPLGYLGNGADGCVPYDCASARDCTEAFPDISDCFVWACNAGGHCELAEPACDDADADGRKVGPICACGEPDCDDQDPDVGTGLHCYTGPEGTEGVGVCRSGERSCSSGSDTCLGERVPSLETCNGEDDDCNGSVDDLGTFTCGIGACRRAVAACTNGAPSACVPLAPTTSFDVCNGIDDDCDGAIDEDCATCIHVATDGDDDAALASNGAAAFRSVQAALDFADTHHNVATRVCVAPGAACGAASMFDGPTGVPLTMRNGISLLGGYESTNWTRCADSVTALAPRTAEGVLFPPEITSATGIDGFVIERPIVASVPDSTTSGITVVRARNVLISNVTVRGRPDADYSYGVNVIEGGDATIFRSRIESGVGEVEAIAVRAVDSRVSLEDNCETPPDGVTGRCGSPAPDVRTRSSCSTSTGPSIRAEAIPFTGSHAAQIAVFLDNSPGSRIERSTICAAARYGGNDNNSNDSTQIGVQLVGDASGTLLRASVLDASGETNQRGYGDPLAGTSGIAVRDCGGRGPWIVDNVRVGVTEVFRSGHFDKQCRGIEVLGACGLVVESSDIRATGGKPRALFCGPADGVASRCVIEDSRLNASGDDVCGIGCESGSCTRIAGNWIGGGREPSFPLAVDNGVGLALTGGAAFVDGNFIAGAFHHWIGVYAFDTSARMQNNRIIGSTQLRTPNNFYSTAVAIGSSTGSLADLHSNLIDGGGPCPGPWDILSTVRVEALNVTSAVVRNNIILGGGCYKGVPVRTTDMPRLFENNDIVGGFGVLLTNNGVELSDIAAINAFPGSVASGNISVDPFVNVYTGHVQAASPCIDAGTSAGAPLYDFDGDPRDESPDIGMDEY